MNRTLSQAFPHVYCELDFTNPLELAVATILSAQSTDKGVNLTTPPLFAKYRTAADYAGADREELEAMVRPTGFYRNKANSLMRLGQELIARFDGEVPRTLDELVTLPGVGRKTANVILGNAFDIPGITVDTHFGRLVRRWRWTELEDPVKVEFAIGELDPTQGVDAAQPPGDLPRPPGVSRQEAGVRSVRARQGLPVLRCGSDGSAGGRRVGQGSRDGAPAGAGRALSTAGTMRASTRWTVAVLVVVVALAVALWREVGSEDSLDGGSGGSPAAGVAREHRDADTPEALAGPRARGRPAAVPTTVGGSQPRGARRTSRSNAPPTAAASTSDVWSPAATWC